MFHHIQFLVPNYGDAFELTTDRQQYLDGQIDARYRPWPTVKQVLRG
jgi:hypothetical protein